MRHRKGVRPFQGDPWRVCRRCRIFSLSSSSSHQGPSQCLALQEIPALQEKCQWEEEGKEELSSGLVPRLLQGLGGAGGALLGKPGMSKGWKIQDSVWIEGSSFLSPSFYPWSTKSGWILCDGIFLPHCSSRESSWPLGMGVQLFSPSLHAPKLPMPTSPIASALKILQIQEKMVGKLQTWAGTSRE